MGNIGMKCIGMDIIKRRHYVSQKMRESARLLLQLRRLCPEKSSLEDFLHLHTYNDVVYVVRGMAGDSNEDLQDLNGFKHPYIALKLGYNLKKLPSIKRILALKESDAVGKKEAKDFIKIVNSNWVNCVSAPALSVMRQQKYTKVEELPKTEDVEEFASFRNKEIEKAVKQLEDFFYTLCVQEMPELSSSATCILQQETTRGG
ncbi:hypothetical protein HOLleu_03199 [Holothuria leucospilota]|uniref:Uncharacterized protein n=1 Tax=Holothuria leucospilota TaxID=206669 RepID=A0A9Q1CSJ7_HOLLE|nr:hypothetical protein HOLleu_03199 [Holothuria leucospilota]